MNEELTRVFEKYELEAMIEYYKNNDCSRRVAIELATALLDERAKPKDDVWKNAPDWATSAEVFWESQAQGKRRTGPVFTRELPKTRTREIAENIVHGINGGANGNDIEYVEGVLKRYAEELEGKHE